MGRESSDQGCRHGWWRSWHPWEHFSKPTREETSLPSTSPAPLHTTPPPVLPCLHPFSYYLSLSPSLPLPLSLLVRMGLNEHKWRIQLLNWSSQGLKKCMLFVNKNALSLSLSLFLSFLFFITQVDREVLFIIYYLIDIKLLKSFTQLFFLFLRRILANRTSSLIFHSR